jgi:hypothetical protein
MKRSFALIALTLASGCDGGKTETMQLTVQSTPSVYESPTDGAAILVFGTNVAETNTYKIELTNRCDIGFTPEWGTTYKVTIDYYVDKPKIGSCPPIRSFNGIDETILDSLGTRYYNNVGSNWGGLSVKKIKKNEPWFQLGGYEKPIYCKKPECTLMKVGDINYLSQFNVRAFFELVEINGKREFELKTE